MDSLLSQSSTEASGDRWVDPALTAKARELAARGCVLLSNAGEVLPLGPGDRIALFGRVQKDWIAVGYGSGGDVNAPYSTDLLDALRESGAVQVDEDLAAAYEQWCAENPVDPGEWGSWPFHFEEMDLPEQRVAEAAQQARTAVVVIGRAAGEDRENTLEPGSYYLTDAERSMLTQVTAAFDRTVVVLATGNVMDLSWTAEIPVDAVLLAWLGGMEGARAVADVLTGAVEPGGRLTDTIAARYEDYPSAPHFGNPEANDYVEDVFVGYRYFETFAPDAVLHPFGHGLTYTSFAHEAEVTDADPDAGTDTDTDTDARAPRRRVRARVTNTGERTGSDVVQVYVQAPDGALSRPARELVAFARTGPIEPGATAEVLLDIDLADAAAYDDGGATGHRSAWVLEPGSYVLHVGPDVRAAPPAGEIALEELIVVRQLEEAAAPRHPFERMTLVRDADGSARVAHEPVPLARVDLRERILERLPQPLPGSGESELTSLAAVARGELSLEEFVASLPPQRLAELAYGDVVMDSPLGAPGNAGALGGVSEELRALDVPPAITTDGPSGIRLSAYASLLPCGTALASTWDPQAVQELAALHGQEMARKGSDILLSPGMNIHRNPLCGRNFEYFAEDPLVTGEMASAVVRGIQSSGRAACPKHFAANNQETNRTRADSRVSERALREIYLRGFERCVREASPRYLMTSYNRINGVWAHYDYDLVTTILRGQWGFDGCVITDWWMQMAPDPDFPDLADSAYRVRAQVDVLMPGSTHHGGTEREDSVLESFARPEGITLGEMQRTAINVLRSLLRDGLVAD